MKNIVRKGEIACNKQFLLFSKCFLPYIKIPKISEFLLILLLICTCPTIKQRRIIHLPSPMFFLSKEEQTSALYGNHMARIFHFKICFNLDQSKILSSGNGLILISECFQFDKV